MHQRHDGCTQREQHEQQGPGRSHGGPEDRIVEPLGQQQHGDDPADSQSHAPGSVAERRRRTPATPRPHAKAATNHASAAVDVAVESADPHGWRAAVAAEPGTDRLLMSPAVRAAPTSTTGASTATRRQNRQPKSAVQPDTTAATTAGTANAR